VDGVIFDWNGVLDEGEYGKSRAECHHLQHAGR
jgi:hypothetical protein